MVFRVGSDDLESSVATTITSESPVTGRGPNLASEPNDHALVGMAPAEPIPQQLDKTVQETLNKARAPFTTNYPSKWKIFWNGVLMQTLTQ